MNKSIELRDDTYYDDLIYEVKRLVGFDVPVNFDVWTSIAKRKDNIRGCVNENNVISVVSSCHGISSGNCSGSAFFPQPHKVIIKINTNIS